MKHILIIICSLLFGSSLIAQNKDTYDPKADAEKDIEAAILKAKQEKKYVLIQAGGNWCSWCLEFIRVAKADKQLDSAINSSFVWYHLNMSPQNMNTKTFEKLGFPQRFGFPVFIVLDQEGKRLHTQNSGYLEDGKKSYDKAKVLEFFAMWSPSAFNPALYEVKPKTK